MPNSMLRLAICAALAAATPALASEAPLPPAESVILTNGVDKVTVRDFEAVLTRVPEGLRFETRASLERISNMVDEVYVNRVLAREAAEMGIDKDPVVQARMKQLQEAYLAALAIEALEKKTGTGDLEVRAREIYNADRAKYQEPEMARVQIGMIDHECRTPQETQGVAAAVAEKARKGEDLKALTDAVRTGRDTGRRRFEVVAKRGDLEPALEALAFEKLRPGEVSDPVEIRGGYAVVKLIEKRAAREMTFDMVKRGIIDAERTRIQRAAVDNRNRRLHSDPNLKLDRDLLLALKTEVDTSRMERARDEALKATRKGN
jgi:peptidyl-prolyl cis-trans isomerase C